MQTQTATPPTDAFTSYEATAQTDYGTWVDLLRDEKNHRGLTRITVEVHAGRAGYREIGELKCADKDGAAIVGSGDLAEINPEAVGAAAFQVAKKDHKREARARYRLQLWKAKKGAPDQRGDYATIVMSADGYVDPVSNTDPAGGVLRILQEENRQLRVMLKDLFGSQVQMSEANAQTMLNAIELGKVTSLHRMEVAEQASRLNTRATPEDWNRRWDSMSRNLERPITMAMGMLQTFVHQQNGGTGPAPHPNDGSQQAAQAFFDGLSAEQKDKLRDGLPQGCFQAIAEVIHGPADQWATERYGLKNILQSNVALLMRVLTPEQFAELSKVG